MTQGPSGRVRKTWVPPGLDPRTDQTIASRYKDLAIQTHTGALLGVAV